MQLALGAIAAALYALRLGQIRIDIFKKRYSPGSASCFWHQLPILLVFTPSSESKSPREASFAGTTTSTLGRSGSLGTFRPFPSTSKQRLACFRLALRGGPYFSGRSWRLRPTRAFLAAN